MHEDITVCDNSLFFLSGEIFTTRTNTFLFPLLFLYLYKDSEESVSQRSRLPPRAHQTEAS